MIPIEVFVLRQKTRPSEEESFAYFFDCMMTEKDTPFLDWLSSKNQPRLPIRTANLNNETDDIEKTMKLFFKAEGCEHYLNNSEDYVLKEFHFLSGALKEETRLVVVFSTLNVYEKKQKVSEVDEFLKRGKRWEELKRYGDALECYFIGLLLYPQDPELLLAQSRIQIRLWSFFNHLEENLKKVLELKPASGEAPYLLGLYYRKVANSANSQIKGGSREDLKNIALGLLQRAAALEPDNIEFKSELKSLSQELGIAFDKPKKSGFFN